MIGRHRSVQMRAGTAIDARKDHATGRRLLRSRQLCSQVGHVLADLPVFVTSPLFRSWHLRWGATAGEVCAALPGDALLTRPQYRSTRAIDIQAPSAAVWPWLVQVGCLRAGWYSNDLLDNLARPSATCILPEFQHLTVGQWVPMAPSAPNDRNALTVHSFAIDSWMLWTKPDSTWAWRLTPTESGGTRLVTRIRATYDWRHPGTALLGVLLMEFGDFAMLRRMLRGIKARAERFSTRHGPDSTSPVVLRVTNRSTRDRIGRFVVDGPRGRE